MKGAFSAALVELLYSTIFDLRFVGDAQLSLYLQFYGKAMGIPPRPARSIVTLHGLIAGDDILEHPG
jgi:hypothetical protein